MKRTFLSAGVFRFEMPAGRPAFAQTQPQFGLVPGRRFSGRSGGEDLLSGVPDSWSNERTLSSGTMNPSFLSGLFSRSSVADPGAPSGIGFAGSTGSSLRSFPRTVLYCALATVTLPASNARADLLVLNAAGSASYILRLDTETGAALGAFRQGTEAYYTMTLSPRNELCVASNILGEHTLQGFAPDGRYQGDLARNVLTGLDGGMRGPDGAIYAIGRDDTFTAAGEVSSVLRIDPHGAKRWVPYGIGGMTAPVTLAFSPAGDLCVGDAKAGVLRFAGATGAPLGVLVPLGRDGLADVAKLLFGPDGRLYVASRQLNAVLRFDAVSGASVGPWVTPGRGGLVSPSGMAFGPDGHFYVTSSGTNQILRYDGGTGAPLGIFATAAATPGDPRVRWRDIVFTSSIRTEGMD